MGWVSRIILLAGLLTGMAHALFTGQGISAYRVANNKITVDGRPDSVWREISARQFGYSEISFSDYSKIVLLEPDSIRNDPPQDHFTAPTKGSVVMLAAYDASALYFFFIVRENNSFAPASLSCGQADLWKGHAVEVYVDPSAFSPTLYSAYFSADANEFSYGTSSKSVQMAKPVMPQETREFFRDRTVGNRFALRSGSGAKSVSTTHSATDVLTYGVEMRIPFASAADFPAGKSMFISWGYNHFKDSPRTSCAADPIAYRWAKNYKDYSDSTKKPPGWVAGNTTHYDPLASYDGWGQLTLLNEQVNGNKCQNVPDSTWDLAKWRDCNPQTTPVALSPRDRRRALISAFGPGFLPEGVPLRDIRGRRSSGTSVRLFATPAATASSSAPAAPPAAILRREDLLPIR